jgi:hypothetical protein
VAANIVARGSRASVIVAMGRDAAIPAGKADNRSRLVPIAIIVAVTVRNHRVAATPARPAAPASLGGDSQRRDGCNQAKKEAEQRNHDS